MPDLVVRLRVAGDQDVKKALDSLGAQAEAVGVKIMPLADGNRRLNQEARGALRAMGDFAQTLSGVSGVLSIAVRGNAELEDKLQRVTVGLSIGATAINLFRNATQFATQATNLFAAAQTRAAIATAVAAAPIAALIAGAAALGLGIGYLIAQTETYGRRADEARQATRDWTGEVDASVASAKAAAIVYAETTSTLEHLTKVSLGVPGAVRGLKLSLQGLLGPEPTFADVDRERREKQAEEDRKEAKRRAEEAARERQRKLDEERRAAAEMIMLRSDTARAMFDLQGRSFEAQLAQLTGIFQRERLEAQGQKERLLLIEQRYWAQYATLAKRSLEDVAQRARATVEQIRDIDMSILAVRKEFFGIGPTDQIAALEAFKKTLGPGDTQRLLQVNRELLGIYRDQSDSLQQQAADLREKAGAEGVSVVQRTAMLAKAKELEETAGRLRLELPGKTKELGQEVLTALTNQRQGLLGQFDELRTQFADITTASAAATKRMGDQFTALAQHIVKSMGAALAGVSAMMGKPMQAPQVQIPGFTPPGGIEFPQRPPATSPVLTPPVPAYQPYVRIEVPQGWPTPSHATGAVTSAMTMESLAAAGGGQLLRVLEKFIAEGGGKGITVNNLTIPLTADEEELIRKIMERIASYSRRTPGTGPPY